MKMDFKKLSSVSDPRDIAQYLDFTDMFANSEGNKALVDIIMRFMSSKAVVRKALFVLLKLLLSPGGGVDFDALLASNAMEAIVIDMHFHADDQRVQERGFRIFAIAAAQSPGICTALLDCGAMEHISSTLRLHTEDARLCKYGLRTVYRVLARSKGSRGRLCAADMIDSIALALSSFRSDSEVQAAGFAALYAIAGLAKAHADTMMSMGLGKLAFDAMRAFESDPALVHRAVVFVSRLTRGDTAPAQFPKWCDLDVLLRVARAYDDFREDSLLTLAAAAALDPSGRLFSNGGAQYIFDVVGQWNRTSRSHVPSGLTAIDILTGSTKCASTIGRNGEWLERLAALFDSNASDANALNTLAGIVCNVAFNDRCAQVALSTHKTVHALIRSVCAPSLPSASRELVFRALGNVCGDCVENRMAAADGGAVRAIERSYDKSPLVREVHESAARALEVILATDEVRAKCLTPELMRRLEDSQRLFPSAREISNARAALGREQDARVSCAGRTGVCTSALVPMSSSPCPAKTGSYCPACCVPQQTFFCVTCYTETGEVLRLCQSCVKHHDDTHTFIKSFMSRRCTCDLAECKVQKKKPRVTYDK